MEIGCCLFSDMDIDIRYLMKMEIDCCLFSEMDIDIRYIMYMEIGWCLFSEVNIDRRFPWIVCSPPAGQGWIVKF